MKHEKVAAFMQLAGQKISKTPNLADSKQRELEAKLLLSEVLEYVIKGLGVTPVFNGTAITDANVLEYHSKADANPIEMLDGLADVGYTMYWNALAFGMPLEKAFEFVCDNNLEKFVLLKNWSGVEGELAQTEWHCNLDVSWPTEVTTVSVLKVNREYYAVGKDQSGKVRKPSSYRSVDLTPLLA